MKRLSFALIICIFLSIGLPALAGDCPPECTPGFWKSHPEAWGVDEITTGALTYTTEVAIAIMKYPLHGDKSCTLQNHLVAAKLNIIINGTDASCLEDTIAEAEAWLKENPCGSGVAGSSYAWLLEGESLLNELDEFNNGLLCEPPGD